MNKPIEYVELFETITDEQPLKSDCNSLSIFNEGTATAQVNNRILLSQAEYIVNGNANEINRTTYNIQFITAGTKILKVTRKSYKNIN